MFSYEKKLQYPVKICNSNPALAKVIISQYGGPQVCDISASVFPCPIPSCADF